VSAVSVIVHLIERVPALVLSHWGWLVPAGIAVLGVPYVFLLKRSIRRQDRAAWRRAGKM
jgi:hypothetical protein